MFEFIQAHLLFGDAAYHKDFAVVHTQHVQINNTHHFSLYLYSVMDCVGIVIKRCRTNKDDKNR